MRESVEGMSITLLEVRNTLNSHTSMLCDVILGGYNIPALPWLVPKEITSTFAKLKSAFVVSI